MPADYIAWARSHWLTYLIYSLAFLIVALSIFQAGVYVGHQQSAFARGVGDSYERIFGERPGQPGMRGMMAPGAGMPNGHGAFGTVIAVSASSLAVAGVDKVEKTARLSDDTIIRKGREDASAADIRAGDTVIIFGDPGDDGVIDARLVRIMPPLPPAPTSTSPRF